MSKKYFSPKKLCLGLDSGQARAPVSAPASHAHSARCLPSAPAAAPTFLVKGALSLLLGLGLTFTSSSAAGGDFNADETGKLKAVEQKLFVRNYDDDAAEVRIERIEKRMFGDADSGDVHARLAKIVEIAKPFDKPKVEPSRAGATKFGAPQPKQQSAEDERLRQEDAREQARIRAMQAAADEVNQLLAEAVSLYKSQRSNEALDKFQQVVRLAPDNAEAHFSIGVIFEAQHRYKEALAAYQRASDLNPEKRDYKEAVAIVMKKSRIDDDPQKAELRELASEASSAYKRGEYFSALDLYKQLDQKSPRQALIKYNIGTIYLALKNPVQAKEAFEEAYKLKPDEPRFKEAFDRLNGSLQSQQDQRLAVEKTWEHPGKTPINYVNNGNGNVLTIAPVVVAVI
jgi:tetratricopeptide (TPR) repeat protein